MLNTRPAAFSRSIHLPERGTEIAAVMKVLRLNEDVRVEQVGYQTVICSERLSSWNVATFEIPSIRKASR